ncbi:mannose-1-phosphate guanylyltransferase, partial [bacterium]|nr:mannose-1-phosphate guanylyltransferase [bacterium]
MKILILAGGFGKRLWPLSSQKSPKQLIPLIGNETLLQKTYKRMSSGFKSSDIFIATSKEHLVHIRKQLPNIKSSQLIIEPVRRNTAAAIGLATALISKKNPKEIIVTINSDHYIKNVKKFISKLKVAEGVIKKNPDNILLLGIKPTYPETGYGYIKLKKTFKKFNADKVYEVDSFTEKPKLNTAKRYLKNRNYLWNPAYFVFRADTMLNNFKSNLFVQYKILKKIQNKPSLLNKEFKKIKAISIDYGIMEKANNLICMPIDIGWSDIGHWQTIYDMLSVKKNDNVIQGKYLQIDSQGNLIFNYTDKLVSTIGINNSIIVETDKVTLVCQKDKAQDVKKMVELLSKKDF